MAEAEQEKKEDLRQRRSKQRLAQALLELMEERPFREISVVEICRQAMVHRTTFYAHFEDKEALFRYVLGEMISASAQTRVQTAQKMGARQGILEELRKGLEFFKVHRKFYLSGMTGAGSPELREVETAMGEALQKLAWEESSLGKERCMSQIMGAFYAGGLVSLVRWWLENDTPVEEERLIALLDRLLPEQL